MIVLMWKQNTENIHKIYLVSWHEVDCETLVDGNKCDELLSSEISFSDKSESCQNKDCLGVIYHNVYSYHMDILSHHKFTVTDHCIKTYTHPHIPHIHTHTPTYFCSVHMQVKEILAIIFISMPTVQNKKQGSY